MTIFPLSPARISGRRFCLLAAVLAVAGCGPVIDFGASQPPANVFRLEPLATRVATPPASDWRILIPRPTSMGGLDTDRIAVVTGPLEIRYYADARWTEPVPDMVQALLVDSFEAAAGAVALTRDSAAAGAPVILEADLRDFEADVSDEAAPEVIVRIAFRVLRTGPTRLVASRAFRVRTAAAGTQAAQLARAFNDALGDVLTRAVEWTVAVAADTGTATATSAAHD